MYIYTSQGKGGRGSVQPEKMLLNIFWRKIVRDDDECIGLFLYLWHILMNEKYRYRTEGQCKDCMSREDSVEVGVK
jgi:hypothetical protein